jgi:hypothetical protein
LYYRQGWNFNPVNRAEFNPEVENAPCSQPLTMLLANFILLSRTMFILRECTNERRNLAEKDDAPTRIQIGYNLVPSVSPPLGR